MQVGDAIPTDGILISGTGIQCSEASLTGESRSVKKSKTGDCFLLSSCLVTDGDECRILVTGIGAHSQWGRIKVNLVTEAENTPLQDKLEHMSTQVLLVVMAECCFYQSICICGLLLCFTPCICLFLCVSFFLLRINY